MERKRTSLAAQSSGPRTFSKKSKSQTFSTVAKPSATPVASQDDSQVTHPVKEVGPAEKVRRKNNNLRNQSAALGKGKTSIVETD